MVDLQVKFTRDVIGVLKLKDDHVLAMVEIDNETSLLQAWGGRSLDRALLGDYRTEWLRQWREYRKSTADAPLEGDDYIGFVADRDRHRNSPRSRGIWLGLPLRFRLLQENPGKTTGI